MGNSLTGRAINTTQTWLLQLGAAITSSLQRVLGGDGTESALSLSTAAAKVTGDFEATGTVTFPLTIEKAGKRYFYFSGTNKWHEVRVNQQTDGTLALQIDQDGVTTP